MVPYYNAEILLCLVDIKDNIYSMLLDNNFIVLISRRLWLRGSERVYHTKGPWFEPQRGHHQDFGLSASADVDLVCHLG